MVVLSDWRFTWQQFSFFVPRIGLFTSINFLNLWHNCFHLHLECWKIVPIGWTTSLKGTISELIVTDVAGVAIQPLLSGSTCLLPSLLQRDTLRAGFTGSLSLRIPSQWIPYTTIINYNYIIIFQIRIFTVHMQKIWKEWQNKILNWRWLKVQTKIHNLHTKS